MNVFSHLWQVLLHACTHMHCLGTPGTAVIFPWTRLNLSDSYLASATLFAFFFQ